MKLSEALETKKIGYLGSRPDYQVHDYNPSVLTIDKAYNVDGNGESVLGFNLNYLDNLSEKEKKQLVKKVNQLDNKIINVGAIKGWLRALFNTGDYDGLSIDKKVERYQEIVKKFPQLKKIIRRYKKSAIVRGK